jgi:hypothetical protein
MRMRNKHVKVAAMAAFLVISGIVLAFAWFSNKEIKELYIDLAGKLDVSVIESYTGEANNLQKIKVLTLNGVRKLDPSAKEYKITITNNGDSTVYARLGVIPEWRNDKGELVSGDLSIKEFLNTATMTVTGLTYLSATPTPIPSPSWAGSTKVLRSESLIPESSGEYETFFYFLISAAPTPGPTPKLANSSNLQKIPAKGIVEVKLAIPANSNITYIPPYAEELKLVFIPEAIPTTDTSPDMANWKLFKAKVITPTPLPSYTFLTVTPTPDPVLQNLGGEGVRIAANDTYAENSHTWIKLRSAMAGGQKHALLLLIPKTADTLFSSSATFFSNLTTGVADYSTSNLKSFLDNRYNSFFITGADKDGLMAKNAVTVENLELAMSSPTGKLASEDPSGSVFFALSEKEIKWAIGKMSGLGASDPTVWLREADLGIGSASKAKVFNLPNGPNGTYSLSNISTPKALPAVWVREKE